MTKFPRTGTSVTLGVGVAWAIGWPDDRDKASPLLFFNFLGMTYLIVDGMTAQKKIRSEMTIANQTTSLDLPLRRSVGRATGSCGGLRVINRSYNQRFSGVLRMVELRLELEIDNICSAHVRAA